MEWPKLKRDRVGLWVKLANPLKSGTMLIPKGTICLISRWHGGAHLWSKACKCCGKSVSITHVKREKDMILTDKPRAKTFTDWSGDICIDWKELCIENK